ncbi:abscisic acid 8'-hydroxylase 1-like isoform X2 [Coffea arabica]|uniref:Abscisic acid 8'-hydroxylase 1-like isoform X2 n=1 Tax=Coffea arabica TaxID=13443 RepID=A0ABM4V1X6_COFAR
MSVEYLVLLLGNYHYILLASVLALGVTVLLSKETKRGKSGIPGSLGIPFLGETLSFLSANNSNKGCYEFVRLRRSWYGKWFKTRIFGKIHVYVPSVDGAKTIFANDFALFNKGYVKSMADAVGKNSLLCVPHESHRRIRRLLSEPFSMNSLSKFVQKIDCMLSKRLEKLERDGQSFVVLDFNMKARRRLMETFKGMIACRRTGSRHPEDFLQSMLQRDQYPDNEKLSDEEIMDNLLTLIIAGQTTTAAAMTWSVKFLDEHQGVQDRLREEQLSILRNKPNGALLTLEDLNNMSYASKVVKETLRMSNILLWFPRVALDNCTIEGFEIKKGWHVNVDATCIHQDPEIYKDPMLFNPSRFDEMQKPYSYIPFGSGPRTCLGINMAKLTMLVFLHRLTTGYMWTVDDLDPHLEGKAHIPRLRSGCPITLTALKNEHN